MKKLIAISSIFLILAGCGRTGFDYGYDVTSESKYSRNSSVEREILVIHDPQLNEQYLYKKANTSIFNSKKANMSVFNPTLKSDDSVKIRLERCWGFGLVGALALWIPPIFPYFYISINECNGDNFSIIIRQNQNLDVLLKSDNILYTPIFEPQSYRYVFPVKRKEVQDGIIILKKDGFITETPIRRKLWFNSFEIDI